jgi:hypothetical protein
MRTALIGFIWLATAIDIWCCQWLTADGEMNPVARWLLVHYDVWTLVAAKVVGTWIVTEWLRHLRFFYTAIVASVMAVLLMILSGVIQI